MAGRKQTAAMELAIGATIIAGVILLIVMLMAWGNTTSFLGRHYRVVVNMVNVGGLKEGAPVKMGGFQIGRVATIQIQQGGTDMEIILDIDENRLLPEDSTAKVSTAGLVGDAFLEIIPGKSASYLKRATTVAEAARLESSPLPDLSELFTKVTVFGDQLTVLINNLNDIIGDNKFRSDIKSLANNMDAVAYQANVVLRHSESVISNIDTATKDIAALAETLNSRVDDVTQEVRKITGKVGEIADKASSTLDQLSDKTLALTDKVGDTLDNMNGGITDIRKGVNATLSNPEFSANLNASLKNITIATDKLAKADLEHLLANLNRITDDLASVSAWGREVTSNVQAAQIAATVKTLGDAIGAAQGAINSMTEVVDKVKAEPVLALSVNKAADRIVKMKFDEMSRQPQFRTSDEVLREINRWVGENMKQGYFTDPKFTYEQRPYTLNK